MKNLVTTGFNFSKITSPNKTTNATPQPGPKPVGFSFSQEPKSISTPKPESKTTPVFSFTGKSKEEKKGAPNIEITSTGQITSKTSFQFNTPKLDNKPDNSFSEKQTPVLTMKNQDTPSIKFETPLNEKSKSSKDNSFNFQESFSFGTPTDQATKPDKEKNKLSFSFGDPSGKSKTATASDKSPGFSFGSINTESKPADTKTEKPKEKTSFSFGNTPDTSKTAFSFGSEKTKEKSSGFSFGSETKSRPVGTPSQTQAKVKK